MMYPVSAKRSLDRKYIQCKCWYVIYTRPNFEKKVDYKLREIGFFTYLPLQKELRHWNDRKAWIETPLFRSYVFIKTNLKEKDKAFKVYGILNYLRIGSRLAVLTEEEIERIKQICLYHGKINIEFNDLKIGRKVEICEGIFKGLTGFLIEINDNKKLRIHIDGLNCFASVILDYDTISLKYLS